MFTPITPRRLSVGSVYKLWFIGLSVSLMPLGIMFGALALFGLNTVTWNQRPLHGIAGLAGGLLIGIFLAILSTAILGSAAALGLWLYSKFRPLALLIENDA